MTPAQIMKMFSDVGAITTHFKMLRKGLSTKLTEDTHEAEKRVKTAREKLQETKQSLTCAKLSQELLVRQQTTHGTPVMRDAVQALQAVVEQLEKELSQAETALSKAVEERDKLIALTSVSVGVKQPSPTMPLSGSAVTVPSVTQSDDDTVTVRIVTQPDDGVDIGSPIPLPDGSVGFLIATPPGERVVCAKKVLKEKYPEPKVSIDEELKFMAEVAMAEHMKK